jgi:hypothetical protein
VLLRRQAGARYSQSPIEADGGAVINNHVAMQRKLLVNIAQSRKFHSGEGEAAPVLRARTGATHVNDANFPSRDVRTATDHISCAAAVHFCSLS